MHVSQDVVFKSNLHVISGYLLFGIFFTELEKPWSSAWKLVSHTSAFVWPSYGFAGISCENQVQFSISYSILVTVLLLFKTKQNKQTNKKWKECVGIGNSDRCYKQNFCTIVHCINAIFCVWFSFVCLLVLVTA